MGGGKKKRNKGREHKDNIAKPLSGVSFISVPSGKKHNSANQSTSGKITKTSNCDNNEVQLLSRMDESMDACAVDDATDAQIQGNAISTEVWDVSKDESYQDSSTFEPRNSITDGCAIAETVGVKNVSGVQENEPKDCDVYERKSLNLNTESSNMFSGDRNNRQQPYNATNHNQPKQNRRPKYNKWENHQSYSNNSAWSNTSKPSGRDASHTSETHESTSKSILNEKCNLPLVDTLQSGESHWDRRRSYGNKGINPTSSSTSKGQSENKPRNIAKNDRSENGLADSGRRSDFGKKSEHTAIQINRVLMTGRNNSDFVHCLESIKELHDFTKVSEIESDLFALSDEYSLAHCVAEDMAMGSGIAVHFRREFKRVDELYAQKQKQGGLAILNDKNRYIYYLVTKRISNGKPTYQTLFESLVKMKNHLEMFKVQKVAMPRIGCGLDRLEWSVVKPMLEHVFQNTEVHITVCNFQQTEQDEASSSRSMPRKATKCFVVDVKYPLVEIEAGTIVIYLGSEDGFVSSQMERLDNKFRFINSYKSIKKVAGEILTCKTHNDGFVLCGFIIKKNHCDEFDFINFQKCIVSLNKWNSNRENKYCYVGFEAFHNDDDDLLMKKIVSLLAYGLRNVEVYICWPGDLGAYMPRSNYEG